MAMEYGLTSGAHMDGSTGFCSSHNSIRWYALLIRGPQNGLEKRLYSDGLLHFYRSKTAFRDRGLPRVALLKAELV